MRFIETKLCAHTLPSIRSQSFDKETTEKNLIIGQSVQRQL